MIGYVEDNTSNINKNDLDNVENKINQNTEQLLSLTQHSTEKSGLDDDGIFTVVNLKRADGTLYCKSELYDGTSPCYKKRRETYYSNDGSTAIKTINYSRTYNEDELLVSEVIE